MGAALGDCKYYVGTNQAVGAETDVDYDTAEYDALERGTFSTSANSYTSTSGGRIWIVAQVRIGAINDDESIQLFVEVGGVEKLVSYFYNDTDNDTPIQTVTVAGTLNLSASDVVKVRCATSSSETTQQKLDELDKLATGGYITPEEYKAKRKAIMKQY